MKMMATCATALLMAASPAAAQKADQDTICFVAVSSFLTQLSEKTEPVDPTMVDSTKVAIGFYVGRLTQRFPGALLAPEISAAKKATFALPLDEQKKLLMSCMGTFQGELRKLVEASKG